MLEWPDGRSSPCSRFRFRSPDCAPVGGILAASSRAPILTSEGPDSRDDALGDAGLERSSHKSAWLAACAPSFHRRTFGCHVSSRTAGVRGHSFAAAHFCIRAIPIPQQKGYRMTGRLILVAAAMALGTSGAIAAQPTSTPGGATPATPATSATPATPADPSTGTSATPATPATAADPATPATSGAQTPTDTTDTATTAQPDQKPKKHKKR
jgi:hypothetical protein